MKSLGTTIEGRGNYLLTSFKQHLFPYGGFGISAQNTRIGVKCEFIEKDEVL